MHTLKCKRHNSSTININNNINNNNNTHTERALLLLVVVLQLPLFCHDHGPPLHSPLRVITSRCIEREIWGRKPPVLVVVVVRRPP